MKSMIRVFTMLSFANWMLAGTIFQLTQYGQYDLLNSGGSRLRFWSTGTMTETNLNLTAHVIDGEDASAYPAVFNLHASLAGLPSLGSVFQSAAGLPSQPEVYGPDHGNTIMFDFSEIYGSANWLKIGLNDRMGMVYLWNGRVMVNFWVYLASQDVNGIRRMMDVGDLIFYADPMEDPAHTPEAATCWLVLAPLLWWQASRAVRPSLLR